MILVALVALLGSMIWAVMASGTEPYEKYESIVARDEPVAQFRFDDAAGSKTLVDSAGSGSATAESSGITLGGEGPFGGSKSGSFAGGAFAKLSADPLQGATAFTAEGWVYWGGGSTYGQPIFDFGSSTTNYMYLTPASSLSKAPMLFEIHTSSGSVSVKAKKTLTVGVWEYVAVSEALVGSSYTLTLYLNGAVAGETTLSTITPASLGSSLPDDYLGRSQGSSEPVLSGSLSNVAFYNKALTKEQIKEHYDEAEFPVNTEPPTISGSVTEGGTLTVSSVGKWIGVQTIKYTYQWERCAGKGECAAISKATKSSYSPVSADVGQTLRVAVHAENSAGKGSALSAQTETVEGEPANTELPVISGSAEVGQILTVSTGSWRAFPSPTFTYVWETCNKSGKSCKSTGATGGEYEPVAEQVTAKDTLRAIVTATNTFGKPSAASEATPVVTAGPPRNTAAPTISGILSEGKHLIATPGTWAGTTPLRYEYRWERCAGASCENITGATGEEYELGPSDVGKTVRVRVEAINSIGSATSTSRATAPVASACTDTWTGANDGVWQTASNWSRDSVPGATDVACVAAGVTVQITGGANRVGVLEDAGALAISGGSMELASTAEASSVNALTLENATLSGGGSVYVSGSLDWGSNSVMSGSGSTIIQPAVAGTIEASCGCEPLFLTGRTLDNEGTLRFGWGALLMSEGAQLENAGTFEDNSEAGAYEAQLLVAPQAKGSAPRLTNTGVFDKTSGAGTSTVAIEFTNLGVVEAQQGRLDFSGGGIPRELATGSWIAQSGASIVLSAGKYWIGEEVNLSAVQVTGASVKRTLHGPPPTGTLTAPSASYLRGQVSVAGTASDEEGIASWALQITPAGQHDWQTACEATTPTSESNYACDLETTAYPDGSYEIRASITDDEEETYSTPVVTTTIDNTPPSGSLAAPAQYVRGTVDVHGSASDATSGVASWQLQIAQAGHSSWQNACAALSSPNEGSEYGCQLDTAEYTDGAYQLRALITDNAGNTNTTATVTTTIDNTPPTGNLTPLAQTVQGWVAVDGSASDATSGVALWQLQISPASQDSWQEACEATSPNKGSEYGCILHTEQYPNGPYQLRATITDKAGNVFTTPTVTTTVDNTPPENTEAPTISGNVHAGRTLTAQHGTWTGEFPSYSYQWESCSPAGEECATIEGATGPEYTLWAGDVGTTVRVQVTASDEEGETRATSAPTSRVEPSPPAEVEAPSISGIPEVHRALHANFGTWTGTALEIRYQWESCDPSGAECAPVEGATGREYELGEGDIGSTLRVRIGAGNPQGALTAVSSPTSLVSGSAVLANTSPPSIAGTPRSGLPVTAEPGGWSESAGVSYGYQWESCDELGSHCEPIEGATGFQYFARAADVGRSLRVLVTAAHEGESRSQLSPATQPVAAAGGVPANTQPAQISGTALRGYTLEAIAGGWQPAAASYRYQWERCDQAGQCTAIEGATTSTYALTEADEQSTLVALVTATDESGSTTSVSEPTGTIEPESPVDFSRPQVSGTEQLGATLSAEPGIWSGSGALSYTYQWESCSPAGTECASIEGATEPEYTIGRGDLGSTLRVEVTLTNQSGSAHALSAATGVIPGGEVSVEQALEIAQHTDPDVLAPSTSASAEEEALAPALSDGEEEISATGTLTSSTISKETPGEFAVNTPAGELSLTPLDSAPDATTTPTIVNGAAALFANTWPATDSIVRPDELGATTLLQLRSREALRTFSWNVDIGPDQQLTQLANGNVAVISASEPSIGEPTGSAGSTGETGEGQPETASEKAESGQAESQQEQEEASLEPLPSAPQVPTSPREAKPGQLEPQDTQAQYEAATSALANAEAQTEGATLMVIEAPTAQDADGDNVPVSLSVSGDTITLTVSVTPSTAFPVLVDPTVAAPSNRKSATATHPVRYGFSDENPETFSPFDQNLKHGQIKVRSARLRVAYNALTPATLRREEQEHKQDGKLTEKERMTTWLAAVQREELQPYVTLGPDSRASSCEKQHFHTEKEETEKPELREREDARRAGCVMPSRSQYREGLRDLVQAYPEVKLWGAWNEPNEPEDPLALHSRRAAQLWDTGESVISQPKLHCGCTLVAGEFAFYNPAPSGPAGYVTQYLKELLAEKRHCKPCSPAMPVEWGLHDYDDVIYTRLRDAESLAKYLVKRGIKPRIWISEAGAELHTGHLATDLVDQPELQEKAAETFLKLKEASNHIDRIYYYEYRAPSEAKVHLAPDEFDSGLINETEPAVNGEGKSKGEARPAYCVLVARSPHGGCPPTVTTPVSIANMGGATGGSYAVCSLKQAEIKLEGTVNPNGGATTYQFEYGPDYEKKTPSTPASVGAGRTPVPVSEKQTVETSPGGPEGNCATMHFRLVATNPGGAATSADAELTFFTAVS